MDQAPFVPLAEVRHGPGAEPSGHRQRRPERGDHQILRRQTRRPGRDVEIRPVEARPLRPRPLSQHGHLVPASRSRRTCWKMTLLPPFISGEGEDVGDPHGHSAPRPAWPGRSRATGERERTASADEVPGSLLEAVDPAPHPRQRRAGQHLEHALLRQVADDVLRVVVLAAEHALAPGRDVQVLERARADVVAPAEALVGQRPA